MGYLTELVSFDLNSNPLTGSVPTKFPVKITSINLGTTGLTGQILFLPPNLNFIHIDATSISGMLPTFPDQLSDIKLGSTSISGQIYANNPVLFSASSALLSRVYVDDISKLSLTATTNNPGFCDISNNNIYVTQVAYLSGVCRMNNLIVNTECGVVQQIATDLRMNFVNSPAFTSLTGTCCSGFGITCDENNHIISIKWENKNLNGVLDTAKIELLYSFLQSFDISGNDVGGTISPGFTSNLIFLDLSGNKIKGNLGNVRFTKMKTLNLSNNQLNGTLLSIPPNIISLNVSNNALGGNLPLFPRSLSNLDISYNLFTGNLSFFNLSTLNIGHNLINNIFFNHTQSLTTCNLLENNLFASNYPLNCLIAATTTTTPTTSKSSIKLTMSTKEATSASPMTLSTETVDLLNTYIASTENDFSALTSVNSVESDLDIPKFTTPYTTISASTYVAILNPVETQVSVLLLFKIALHSLINIVVSWWILKFLYNRKFKRPVVNKEREFL